MRNSLILATLVSACLAGLPLRAAQTAAEPAAPTFVVVLDPGHDVDFPGAISARGKPEVLFNDAMAKILFEKLQRFPALKVVLSRKPGERLSNSERLQRIRAAKPDLVLALHHDSAQLQFFSDWTFEGAERRYCDQFSGYSLLAQAHGPAHEASLAAAREFADRLQAVGQKPSPHHAAQIKGEGREWLDEKRGIYNGDYVWLLRQLEAPVVLLEVGVIVNRAEELRLSDPATVDALAGLLAEAIDASRKKIQQEHRAGGGPPTP